MDVPTAHVLALGAVMFVVGLVGALIKRNLIVLFLCIELMLNAANITFIAFAREMGQPDGQAVVFFVMVLAAAEAGVGLAITIAAYRLRGTLDIDRMNLLKH